MNTIQEINNYWFTINQETKENILKPTKFSQNFKQILIDSDDLEWIDDIVYAKRILRAINRFFDKRNK